MSIHKPQKLGDSLGGLMIELVQTVTNKYTFYHLKVFWSVFFLAKHVTLSITYWIILLGISNMSPISFKYGDTLWLSLLNCIENVQASWTPYFNSNGGNLAIEC